MDAMEYQKGWEVILEELCRQHNVYPKKKKEEKCGGYGACEHCIYSYYEYGNLECRKDYMGEKYEDVYEDDNYDITGRETDRYCPYMIIPDYEAEDKYYEELRGRMNG